MRSYVMSSSFVCKNKPTNNKRIVVNNSNKSKSQKPIEKLKTISSYSIYSGYLYIILNPKI